MTRERAVNSAPPIRATGSIAGAAAMEAAELQVAPEARNSALPIRTEASLGLIAADR